MRGECLQAVGKALKRPVSVAEGQKIEKKIVDAKRQLMREDPTTYQSMSEADRLYAAAERVSSQIEKDAIKKQQQIAKQVLANTEIRNRIKSKPGPMLDHIEDEIVQTFDDKGNNLSADAIADAIRTDHFRRMSDQIDQFGPKMLGIIDNDKAMEAVILELRGTDTGIPEAKRFAEIFKKSNDELVNEYQAAGGVLHQREDYGNPQSHSANLVFNAGKKELKARNYLNPDGSKMSPEQIRDFNRNAWVESELPRLNRRMYVNEDGTFMNDDQMREFLTHAWESISYDGKIQDRSSGGRAGLANSRTAHRQLHYKDGPAYIESHRQFGGLSFMSTLIRHIDGMSKDIALMQKFGPNPDATIAGLIMDGEKEGRELGMAPDSIYKKTTGIQEVYNEMRGIRPPIHNKAIARFMGNFRNLLNIRLGTAGMRALFTDPATAMVSLGAWRMSKAKFLFTELKQLASADARRQARRLGLGMQSMLFSTARMVIDDAGAAWSSKIGGATARAGGLGYVTEAAQQAFGLVMMDGFGHLTKTHSDLNAVGGDLPLLLSKGVNQADWNVWRQARLNDGLLTPDSILAIPGIDEAVKKEAARKLMAIILEETDIAITTPGVREQARLYGNTERGSISGELQYSIAKFKAFPLAMMLRHWNRMLSNKSGQSRVAYGASLFALTMIGGAISTQLNELANFRDPLEMFNEETFINPAFWGRAAVTGGAMSYLGDFLQAETNTFGNSLGSAILGPVYGVAQSFANLTVQNAFQALNGEDPHFNAELIRFVDSFNPTSSLFWAKGVWNHLVIQNLQEMASPGYLYKMKKRSEKEFKQKYFGQPGELPTRAPDFKRIVGGN